MVNESIRIGLANNLSSLRRLSLLSYNELAQYDSPSCYKLCAISRAAGILASRKKSLRRGLPSRTPYAVRQQLVSCYVFKTKKRRTRDSDREREASQHTPNQAHVKHDLSTTGQSSLLHPYPEPVEPLHQPRRCPSRMHLYDGCGP